jgi:hypothetical protein
MSPSAAATKWSSAFIGIMRSLHCDHRQPLSLLPANQHPLLPLPIDAATQVTSIDDHLTPPFEIRSTFLESGITKVAFIRHGNTSPASVDFERTLTEVGRTQANIAGASYGTKLHPFSDEAICSSAPRCVETANIFLESLAETLVQQQQQQDLSMSEESNIPKLSLQSQLYDGTMQPEGSRLFNEIGYAPIRSYLANKNLDDADAAKVVLGKYASSSLDIMYDLAQEGKKLVIPKERDIGRTLLFFAHAVYLPSAALSLAAALDCYDGLDLILDTNTKEAEGYCIDIFNENVSLLCLPTSGDR